MKYDEKTGKKVAETRSDEIQLSFDALKKVAEKANGTFDRQVELAWLLRDIDQSLAIIVDMLGVILNGVCTKADHEEGTDFTVQ